MLLVDVDPHTAQSPGHPRGRLEAKKGNDDVAAAEVPETVPVFCEDNAPGSYRTIRNTVPNVYESLSETRSEMHG